jgi:uncharacterized protein (DUF885 family)
MGRFCGEVEKNMGHGTRTFLRLTLMLAAGLALIPAVPAATTAAAPGDAAFAATFGPKFMDRYWHLHPDDAIVAGYYRVAALQEVPDERERAELHRFLSDSLRQVLAVDATALDPATRADRAVLESQLRAEIWDLDEFRSWEWNPSLYNIAQPFDLLLHTEYAPLEQRLRAVLARLARVPAYYAAAARSLHDPTLEHTQLAIEQNAGALALLGPDLDKQIEGSTLSGTEKALLRQRVGAAQAAINGYIAWLKDQQQHLAAGTAHSFRIGREHYEQKFAFDIATGDTAAGLYQRAQAEKERVLARMELLSEQLWPKYFPDVAPPEDRLERIGTLIRALSMQHVSKAGYTNEVKNLVSELTQWVQSHQLIAMDPDKPLKVRITPDYQQGATDASIDPPGPYDPAAPTFFNVAPLDSLSADAAESYLQEYNRWVLPILAIHEAIPGHYVQLIYANKSPSLIKSVFANTATVEGWAVYGERMMMESGYGDDTAEQWLFYYKWNLREICNVLLDYGVHVQGMSEAEALQLLTHEAFQTDEEARGKWRRVQLTAVQLDAYYAGSSKILALRERLKREQGSQFKLEGFNERLLSFGNAPLSLISDLVAAPAH